MTQGQQVIPARVPREPASMAYAKAEICAHGRLPPPPGPLSPGPCGRQGFWKEGEKMSVRVWCTIAAVCAICPNSAVEGETSVYVLSRISAAAGGGADWQKHGAWCIGGACRDCGPGGKVAVIARCERELGARSSGTWLEDKLCPFHPPGRLDVPSTKYALTTE